MDDKNDLFFIILVLAGLWIAWFSTGGPERATSRGGLFLYPPSPVGSGEIYGPSSDGDSYQGRQGIEREIEKVQAGEDIGSSMGHRALVCSDYLRNISSFLAKEKAAVIVINQVREKIGVMFGCFQYDSRIELENGKTEKIGKIVNQKLPIKVKSCNIETGKIEYKPITNWFNNGNADYFLQFEVEKPYGNGKSQFGVTENHLIHTPDGEIAAGDLRKGDFIYGRGETFLSPIQKSIIIGSILGDGSLKLSKNNYTASLRIGHGKKQIEYCQWKQSLFSNIYLI